MKRTYIFPNIMISTFDSSDNITTASVAVDGISVAEDAMKEKGIKNIQKTSLDALEFKR